MGLKRNPNGVIWVGGGFENGDIREAVVHKACGQKGNKHLINVTWVYI